MQRDPWLCRACVSCLIQGVEPSDPLQNQRILDGLERLGDICPDVEEDGHMVFSALPCDCCGSPERGERFRFNILEDNTCEPSS